MNKVFTLNIKDYFQQEKAKIASLIKIANKVPKLAVIQVGDNPASNKYITNKKKDCEEVGIKFEWYHFPEDITTDELIFNIDDIQKEVDAIIVQMPVPKHINVKAVELAIDPDKDVDGFHPMTRFKPCTPLGIVNYLKACGYDFVGKDIAVIGRSDIVGKPMARMLTDLDATVTLCHSKTKHLKSVCKNADIIISAVGKANMVDKNFIKNSKTTVINVGFDFIDGKMVGDIDVQSVKETTQWCTPIIGSSGLWTRLSLMQNTFDAYVMQEEVDV